MRKSPGFPYAIRIACLAMIGGNGRCGGLWPLPPLLRAGFFSSGHSTSGSYCARAKASEMMVCTSSMPPGVSTRPLAVASSCSSSTAARLSRPLATYFAASSARLAKTVVRASMVGMLASTLRQSANCAAKVPRSLIDLAVLLGDLESLLNDRHRSRRPDLIDDTGRQRVGAQRRDGLL